jgi:hypothetical protein
MLRLDCLTYRDRKLSGVFVRFSCAASENVSKGTIIYKKEPKTTTTAVCRYRNCAHLNRPFETYRVNKRRKDVLALDFKIETNTRNKTGSKYVPY